MRPNGADTRSAPRTGHCSTNVPRRRRITGSQACASGHSPRAQQTRQQPSARWDRRLALLAAVILFAPVDRSAAATCTGLQPSAQRVYEIEATLLQAIETPVEERGAPFDTDTPVSRHGAVSATNNVVSLVEISYRVLLSTDGAVCSTPMFVSLSTGSSRHVTDLAGVTTDKCGRAQMPAHGAVHARTSSDDLEARLRVLTAEAQRLLVANIRAANTVTDDRMLQRTCDGSDPLSAGRADERKAKKAVNSRRAERISDRSVRRF